MSGRVIERKGLEFITYEMNRLEILACIIMDMPFDGDLTCQFAVGVCSRT